MDKLINRTELKHQAAEPVLSPEQMIDALAGVDDILKQIHAQEAKCLDVILTRFCLLNGKAINIANVDNTDIFLERPNYYEYWYKLGTKEQYFLMSREIVIVNGLPALNIVFNAELARDGE